jgi:thioredoxin-dependent peroxiredoxin
MNRKITFKGNPLTLVGRNIKVGNAAPYFRAVSKDLKEVSLVDFKGKIKLITSFPSIDTPVCDLQVKEFNKMAAGLSSDIGISKDLPFAQARFCQANDIKNVLTLSDYKFSSFGINYGLLIQELNLLTRAIIIVDQNDVLRYLQIVEELTNVPDYHDALKNLDQVFKSPQGEIQAELPVKCKACEGGVPALSKDKIERLLVQYRGWQLIEDKKIVKEFKFKDFVEAKYFLDLVSVIAEEQGHHPHLTLIYNKLKITLTTHSSGGLTENDFIMAKIIDELQG